VAILLLVTGVNLAAVTPPAAGNPAVVTAHTKALQLITRSPAMEGAMYACLYRLYMQGMGISRAQNQCEMELPDLGRGGVSSELPGYTGPGTRGGSSGSGGSGVGCPGWLAGPAALGSRWYRNYVDPVNPTVHYGKYSWGAAGEVKSATEWYEYLGLSEAESERRKMEAVREHQEAHDEEVRTFNAALRAADDLSAARKTGDAARIAAAEAALKAATEAHTQAQDAELKAYEKALADPNIVKPGVSQTDPNAPDMCGADTLAFLRECDRVNWITADCRMLQARIQHCVDPALIFPNPIDGSPTCGQQTATPEEMASAMEMWCRRLVRYGPDDDPCSLAPRHGGGNPNLALLGLTWDPTHGTAVVCGSPYAFIAQDSCVAEMTVPTFGRPDVETVVLWAFDKLGGPVFILPGNPPGGGPRPPYDPPGPGD
jgi:hypothetical protein